MPALRQKNNRFIDTSATRSNSPRVTPPIRKAIASTGTTAAMP